MDGRKPTHIDAVITWVDGSDKRHRRKMEAVMDKMAGATPSQDAITGATPANDSVTGAASAGKTRKSAGKALNTSGSELETGRDRTRFRDNGELYYCLRSIRTFAPWIRTIHLVTDEQVPGFLTPGLMERWNVRIVDHRELFASYEWALPTFNSRTIETALWRIPDLAGRFIYLNDDFVLTSPATPEDFFTTDGVVLRGKWNRISRYGPLSLKLNSIATNLSRRLLGITRSMNLLLQIRSARLAGMSRRYFRTSHTPHPVRTETLRTWFKTNPRQFEENIAYRFRHEQQFNGIYLAHHLEIAQGSAVLRDAGDQLMINGEMDFGFTLRRKLKRIRKQEVRFACLQGFERFPPSRQKEITETLDRLYEKT